VPFKSSVSLSRPAPPRCVCASLNPGITKRPFSWTISASGLEPPQSSKMCSMEPMQKSFRRAPPSRRPRAASDRWCKSARAGNTLSCEPGRSPAETQGAPRKNQTTKSSDSQRKKEGVAGGASSSCLFRRDTGNAQQGQQARCRPKFTSGRFIPFLQRMRAAAVAARADRDCFNAQGQRIFASVEERSILDWFPR